MALIQDFGVTGNGIQQPLLKHKWKVTFLGFAGDPEPLTTQAITVDRPKIELAEIELHRYNSVAYVPGKYSYQPANIVFDTDVGGRLHTSIQQQFELQQALIGGFPAPRLPSAIGGAIFKFAVKVEQLGGDQQVLETWIYESAYISNLDYEMNDYSVSEKLTTTMTIRYDIARQIITGQDVKATGGAAI